MAAILSFIGPIWVFDALTDITAQQDLPHLSVIFLREKWSYFRYAFFSSCMTQGNMYKFKNIIF
jgi:hypothetical protein